MFVTNFQEFEANTADRIDKIECLLWENVMEYDTERTEYIKQKKSYWKMKIIDLGWNQNPYSK